MTLCPILSMAEDLVKDIMYHPDTPSNDSYSSTELRFLRVLTMIVGLEWGVNRSFLWRSSQSGLFILSKVICNFDIWSLIEAVNQEFITNNVVPSQLLNHVKIRKTWVLVKKNNDDDDFSVRLSTLSCLKKTSN